MPFPARAGRTRVVTSVRTIVTYLSNLVSTSPALAQAQWAQVFLFEDSSTDEEGADGRSLFWQLPHSQRGRYRPILRAVRGAQYRLDYVRRLQAQGMTFISTEEDENASNINAEGDGGARRRIAERTVAVPLVQTRSAVLQLLQEMAAEDEEGLLRQWGEEEVSMLVHKESEDALEGVVAACEPPYVRSMGLMGRMSMRTVRIGGLQLGNADADTHKPFTFEDSYEASTPADASTSFIGALPSVQASSERLLSARLSLREVQELGASASGAGSGVWAASTGGGSEDIQLDVEQNLQLEAGAPPADLASEASEALQQVRHSEQLNSERETLSSRREESMHSDARESVRSDAMLTASPDSLESRMQSAVSSLHGVLGERSSSGAPLTSSHDTPPSSAALPTTASADITAIWRAKTDAASQAEGSRVPAWEGTQGQHESQEILTITHLGSALGTARAHDAEASTALTTALTGLELARALREMGSGPQAHQMGLQSALSHACAILSVRVSPQVCTLSRRLS